VKAHWRATGMAGSSLDARALSPECSMRGVLELARPDRGCWLVRTAARLLEQPRSCGAEHGSSASAGHRESNLQHCPVENANCEGKPG
jgi:hypothetical protein